jgi:spore coat polysaccharide biosynthesis protein SpsF
MNKPNAVVILQARRNSTRLPDKVLASIAGRTILRHCLDRLRAGSPVPVVLATTARTEDDLLEEEARRAGVRTFRGPTNDVLGRFALVARELGAEYVLRATADNPAVDIDAAARVLNVIVATRADHVVEEGLPHGCAVEAMLAEALFRADRLAADREDREHVTTIMRRDKSCFNAIVVAAPGELRRPGIRLTVDTRADLEYMREIAAELGNSADDHPLKDIIAAADRVGITLADREFLVSRNVGASRMPALRLLQTLRASETTAQREVIRQVLADLRNKPKVAA